MKPISRYQQQGFNQNIHSTSPTRPIHYLKGTPKKNSSRSSSPSNSLREEEISISPAYKRALNENQRLRQELYFLLIDYPDHMTTRSLGISQSERDRTIARAEVQLNRISQNQLILQQYEAISSKFKESLSSIAQIRKINKNIEQTFKKEIKCEIPF